MVEQEFIVLRERKVIVGDGALKPKVKNPLTEEEKILEETPGADVRVAEPPSERPSYIPIRKLNDGTLAAYAEDCGGVVKFGSTDQTMIERELDYAEKHNEDFDAHFRTHSEELKSDEESAEISRVEQPAEKEPETEFSDAAISVAKISLNETIPPEVTGVSHTEIDKAQITTARPQEEARRIALDDFLNAFEFKEVIGSGGISTISLIEQKSNHSRFAYKEVNIEQIGRIAAANPDAVLMTARLLGEEAKLINEMAEIDPKHFPPFALAWTHSERPGFLTKYYPKSSLEKQVGKLSPETAVRYALDAAEAVNSLHTRKNIVLADIKPSQFVRDEQDNVVLIDLNLKYTDPKFSAVSTMIHSAALSFAESPSKLHGTPRYMAPEQWEKLEGKDAVIDARTDIFQMGSMFYEFLTGKKPEGRFKKLAEINPALAQFDEIVDKALANSQADRFQTMQEFIEAIKERTRPNDETPYLEKTFAQLIAPSEIEKKAAAINSHTTSSVSTDLTALQQKYALPTFDRWKKGELTVWAKIELVQKYFLAALKDKQEDSPDSEFTISRPWDSNAIAIDKWRYVKKEVGIFRKRIKKFCVYDEEVACFDLEDGFLTIYTKDEKIKNSLEEIGNSVSRELEGTHQIKIQFDSV